MFILENMFTKYEYKVYMILLPAFKYFPRC